MGVEVVGVVVVVPEVTVSKPDPVPVEPVPVDVPVVPVGDVVPAGVDPDVVAAVLLSRDTATARAPVPIASNTSAKRDDPRALAGRQPGRPGRGCAALQAVALVGVEGGVALLAVRRVERWGLGRLVRFGWVGHGVGSRSSAGASAAPHFMQ